jgi:hypothetical protein
MLCHSPADMSFPLLTHCPRVSRESHFVIVHTDRTILLLTRSVWPPITAIAGIYRYASVKPSSAWITGSTSNRGHSRLVAIFAKGFCVGTWNSKLCCYGVYGAM